MSMGVMTPKRIQTVLTAFPLNRAVGARPLGTFNFRPDPFRALSSCAPPVLPLVTLAPSSTLGPVTPRQRIVSLDIHSAVTLSAVLALLMGISLRYVLRDYPPTLW